jgi:hypothetical protein
MSTVQPYARNSFILKASDGSFRDASEAITDVSRNYTMDAGTQITVNLFDEGMKMLLAGYFRVGTEYTWGGERFVLNAVNVKQGQGDGASIGIELLEYFFHRLKNDFEPQNYRAANGFSFAQRIARKYKLKFVGEQVKGKQQTIKVKAKNNKESVWSVLQRSAGDNQYVCFIADGTLFFASPKYLLGRWGVKSIKYKPAKETKQRDFYFVPIVYPTPASVKDYFLVGIPSVRKAIDSIKEAEGSLSLFGPSARELRAGMTIRLYGLSPAFDLYYLITSVDFEENGVEPVEVTFANVASLSPEDKSEVDKKIAEVTVISGSGGS